MVELGHNLGLTVVAEGVENAEMLTSLSEIHCDVAQGYFVSRPLTEQQLTVWLAQRSRVQPRPVT